MKRMPVAASMWFIAAQVVLFTPAFLCREIRVP